ncbi:MAG: CRISPR-associated protein Cas4 [Candidatus Lokiarchaeota archaeon]|nr:CRISPR-associated protein Cas4 [Candidatus Lokiarchaeota archaeon]
MNKKKMENLPEVNINMAQGNERPLKEYQLNRYQFQELRALYPGLNLYDQPLVGTEDVRQYAYCHRILYFRHVLRAPMLKTYKMEYGQKKHEELQKMKNSTSEEYSQKYYNVFLTDADLGLLGLIDYFEYDGNAAFPVEIKSGNVPPNGLNFSHKLQVVAQAILIEKNFDFAVTKARIYYIKDQQVVDYELAIDDKMDCIEVVRKIQKLLKSEAIPLPTEDKGKCVDCECRKYCFG